MAGLPGNQAPKAGTRPADTHGRTVGHRMVLPAESWTRAPTLHPAAVRYRLHQSLAIQPRSLPHLRAKIPDTEPWPRDYRKNLERLLDEAKEQGQRKLQRDIIAPHAQAG